MYIQYIGRYMFMRMDWGIQKDMIITGKTEVEHNVKLIAVFDRGLKYNIKFNKKKMQFKSKKVKFMDQVFTEKGMRTDDNCVKAISGMNIIEQSYLEYQEWQSS